MSILPYACGAVQCNHTHMNTHDPAHHILRCLSQVLERLDDIGPTSAPRLLTIQEAATALGVSRDTVRRMCDRREIRYVQTEPGAAKRIALADIQAWIDRYAVPPL